MSFGSLFGKSVKDFKTNFKPIFLTIFFFITLPQLIFPIINLIFTGSIVADFSKDSLSAASIIMIIAFSLITLFLWLFALSGITKASLKNKFSFQEIISFGKKSWLKYLGLLIVSGIFLFGLFMLLIIPGIIFFIYWFFSFYIIFDENKGILHSLKRSKELVKGSWWRVCSYLIIIFLLCALVWLIVLVPSIPFQEDFLLGKLSLVSSIEYLMISATTTTLSSIIFYGFFILFYKNIYLELKSKPKNKKEEKVKLERKGFVWYATRISFYLLMALFILSFFKDIFLDNIFTKLLAIFVLIISIMHLFLHAKKTIPILGIILSVLISISLAILALISFFNTLDIQPLNSYNLINESNKLEADHYSSNYMNLQANSIISINLSANRPVDIYLLEEAEFNRFTDNSSDEEWYYMEGEEDVTSWNLTDYKIDIPGRYWVLVINWDKTKDVGYNLWATKR